MSAKPNLLRKPYASELLDLCRKNTHLREFYKAGLGAIKGSERKFIKVPLPALIGCSVQLDAAAESKFPEANRWDYAIEYDGRIFFLEVHPASTSEIECVIKKVDFVKKWLTDYAPEILTMPKLHSGAHKFYWISSGNTALKITPGSRQAKKLAQRNIIPIGTVWDYNKILKKVN